MKVNTINLALHRGLPFSQILEYKEDGKNAFIDFTGYVFKGQIRGSRAASASLLGTLAVTAVGLGQLKIHLTEAQTALITDNKAVYDIVTAKTISDEPELIFTGDVSIGGTATIWENTPPVTSIAPAAGIYNADQSVVLSVNEVGAKIYYTTNGSAPTTASPQYSAPIPVTATTTIRFFAVDAAGNAETPQQAVFTIDKVVPTTVAAPAEGSYVGTQNVTLTPDEAGCTTYYTTDGSVPTTASAQYATPIEIAATTTLRFFSVDAAGNVEAAKSAVYTIS